MWSCLMHTGLPSLAFFLFGALLIAKFILNPIFLQLFPSSASKLQVEKWKKDKVYLFEFPRSPFIPNLSPFCLKIETYLRAKKIDHEVHYTLKGRSKYGQLPFIELNGKQIADSQLIIFALEKAFGTEAGNRIAVGLGRFNDADFRDLLHRDLQTLVDCLGNKKFFFGNTITYADCSVFGQLSSIYYIPTESYGKQVIHDKYQPLVRFLENMRAEVWPSDFTK